MVSFQFPVLSVGLQWFQPSRHNRNVSSSRISTVVLVSFSTIKAHTATPKPDSLPSRKEGWHLQSPAQLGALPVSTWGPTSCISLFISWADAKQHSMCPHYIIQPGKLLSEVGGCYQGIEIRVLKTREVKSFTWGHTAEKIIIIIIIIRFVT